ncbi:MAG: argininosuccinate lyase [Chloroherpetonaceae bacterium]|nr:argininosuccinate lyase [Chloroherpetonaceae bacterium]MDW8438027.1 argininosuccinate lyase [Chloroherpetonaceae bacterium]
MKRSKKKQKPNAKLWGGRFTEDLNALAFEFSKSIHIDKRLYREDIAGSLAHIEMLAQKGIIAPSEASQIGRGLREIEKEIDEGVFPLDSGQEDIHLAIEQRLFEKIGNVAGKLHTARSRNDQIATDERLWLRSAIQTLAESVASLQRALLEKSDAHFGAIMPGYTHLQRAQPILLSHHLLAHIETFERDKSRLRDALARMNFSPLGAAALAGTPIPIDRHKTAKALGFAGIVENSIDAVSDRDYVIEFISACAIAMMHLSRLAEEWVLWSSQEFGFITIADAFATGSSIMPQKKNPDMAELVRGKTGRVYGALISVLTTMKGLPLAYNRDMQEDKVPMFEAFDTTKQCFDIFAEMARSTEFHESEMKKAVHRDFSTATELADYLTKKGVPFREAHEIVGNIVRFCVAERLLLPDLHLKTLHAFSPAFDDDVFEYLNPEKSPARKKSAGSTSPKEVAKQIAKWKRLLNLN